MRTQPVTRLSPASIANRLRRVFREEAVDAAARTTGFMRRKRDITPLALVVACLSSLAMGGTRWLADIQRSLNATAGTAVQYKPFHNQLSKEAFPEFVRQLFEQALGQLVLPVTTPAAHIPNATAQRGVCRADCVLSRCRDELARASSAGTSAPRPTPRRASVDQRRGFASR